MAQADPDEDSPQDIWLWPDGDGIRWWTAYHTRLLDDLSRHDSPSAGLDAPDLILARDRRINWPLEVALRPALGALLTATLKHHAVLRLHLHPELPLSWHRFPFEWLRSGGETLHARLSVHRWRAPDAAALTPLAPDRDLVVLDLLPRAEQHSPIHAIPSGTAQIISGKSAVLHFLATQDLKLLINMENFPGIRGNQH